LGTGGSPFFFPKKLKKDDTIPLEGSAFLTSCCFVLLVVSDLSGFFLELPNPRSSSSSSLTAGAGVEGYSYS
jgi:hypothetical protein